MHLLGSWSLKGALAKIDDESNDGDANEQVCAQIRAKKPVHLLGSWSLKGALAKFEDGDDTEQDCADDEGLPLRL